MGYQRGSAGSDTLGGSCLSGSPHHPCTRHKQFRQTVTNQVPGLCIFGTPDLPFWALRIPRGYSQLQPSLAVAFQKLSCRKKTRTMCMYRLASVPQGITSQLLSRQRLRSWSLNERVSILSDMCMSTHCQPLSYGCQSQSGTLWLKSCIRGHVSNMSFERGPNRSN